MAIGMARDRADLPRVNFLSPYPPPEVRMRTISVADQRNGRRVSGLEEGNRSAGPFPRMVTASARQCYDRAHRTPPAPPSSPAPLGIRHRHVGARLRADLGD